MSLACSHCYYDQSDPMHDPIYQNNVKPFMYLCAAILPSAYIIGLLFSLHTHADMVWKNATTKHSTHDMSTHQKLYPIHILRSQHSDNQQYQHQEQPSESTSTNILIPGR